MLLLLLLKQFANFTDKLYFYPRFDKTDFVLFHANNQFIFNFLSFYVFLCMYYVFAMYVNQKYFSRNAFIFIIIFHS